MEQEEFSNLILERFAGIAERADPFANLFILLLLWKSARVVQLGFTQGILGQSINGGSFNSLKNRASELLKATEMHLITADESGKSEGFP